VVQAMASIPRQEFVPVEWKERAYQDEPLPIGGGQTISQPFIVALMTAALRLSGNERVLEIGTGCGYQAAILSRLSKEVYSVELRPELAHLAAERLERLGFANVHVHCGDGSAGLPDFAPYDAILVAAAAPSLPEPLLKQLSDGGRLIVPVGDASHQLLVCARRQGDEFSSERYGGCRFVPLLGRFGWNSSDLL
jgi:protein-L-isoaspartate(D-aspartate) O-methyltransferase